MKKSILLVAIGMLFLNGCSNKSVTAKAVTPKVNKTTVSKEVVHKQVVHKKEVKEKRSSKKVPKNLTQEKRWGAPTISEAEASKLFGFSVN